MKIFVMRHGATPLNQQKKVNGEVDEPLASEGVEQAKEVVVSIPKSITHIYASPLLRAQQTAQIISDALNLPILTQDELTEIKMGSLAGKAWEEMEFGAELKKKHRSVQFDYRLFGGEAVDGVTQRLLSFFKAINGKHQDDEVLIITHGGIIRTLRFLQDHVIVDETEKNLALLPFDVAQILENA